MFFGPTTKKAIKNNTSYLSRQNPIKTLIKEIIHANKQNLAFLDVGANNGIHILRIAFSFPEIQCIGFEPNQDLVNIMNKTIKLNNISNIEIFNIALGNEEGQFTLNYNPYSTGHASFLKLSHGLNFDKKNR
jgi:tRNA G46 methylase TrmB